MVTKGKMINELKKVGIRVGDKDGSTVGLSHLKTPQIVNLYCQYCVETQD